MPSMLRTSKKARKIAHEILGVPENLRSTKRNRQRRRRLVYEEIRFVR